MRQNPYQRMLWMLLFSFVIMYGVMFLNVDSLDHVYFSITRVYMTLLMVSPMALMMLVMMKHMYSDKRKNALIIALSAVVWVVSLVGLRTQALITDQQYMKAMIPHHSSAIMTSRNAGIGDPEVRRLADGIIKSQRREIRQMKEILKRMESR